MWDVVSHGVSLFSKLASLPSHQNQNMAGATRVSVTGISSIDRSVAKSTKLALGTGAVPMVHRVAMMQSTTMSPGLRQIPCINATHTWD